MLLLGVICVGVAFLVEVVASICGADVVASEVGAVNIDTENKIKNARVVLSKHCFT